MSPISDVFREWESVMRKRVKLGRSQSKKMFRKGADRTHERNLRDMPMRGGIRL